MSGSLLPDAFAHHTWATLQLLDVCDTLTVEQLATAVPGTFGSILDTIRHVVGADASYLNLLTGGDVPAIEDETMSLPEIRGAAVRHVGAWGSLVAGDRDADATFIRHRDDGSESHAPLGIRLAQALHHGTDHRSQICTALTSLGIVPPEIDVWSFAQQDGRAFVTEPAS